MSLRVISGQYRRRILKTPSDDSTRPYTDRVRQIVFDRLNHLLPGAKVADVFAGVGTMGIESLSRGAKSCVFYESGQEVHELLVSNVRAIAPEARTICWKTDVRRTSFRPHGGEDCLPYSLIFFDPPYRKADEIEPSKPLGASLKRLARDSISSKDAVLVLRTPEHFDTPEVALWNVHDCWELSSMMIWILTKPGAFSEDSDSADELSDTAADGPFAGGHAALDNETGGDNDPAAEDSSDDELADK
jgi:16S rRNA (guanine966-N2)-methyltransferase